MNKKKINNIERKRFAFKGEIIKRRRGRKVVITGNKKGGRSRRERRRRRSTQSTFSSQFQKGMMRHENHFGVIIIFFIFV